MNLVGTLAKVAIGVMVSRGVGKMMGGSSGKSSAGGGLGGLLGSLAGGAAAKGGGGLAGMLGSVLSGGGGQGGGAAGGLGGLLNSLGGGQGTAQAGAQGGAAGGLGGLLNQMMGGESTAEPTQQQNTEAEIMLRAMINAAKSDGGVDETEQRKILEHLGEVTQDEVQFVQNEMAQPLDLAGFIQSVPKGLEQQVYVMSLLGIDLDSQEEAQYLDQLANGLGISHDLSNQIHEKVGVPALYS